MRGWLILLMAVGGAVQGHGMMRAKRVMGRRMEALFTASASTVLAGDDAPWRDCSSDASRMFVNNVTIVNDRPLHVGGALNVSVEAWVFERIEEDAPLFLSLTHVTRDSRRPITAYFEWGLCGEHQFQVGSYVFYTFGLNCPAEPGVHHWTLLALIPPEAPRGTYASRISLGAAGDLCIKTNGISVGPLLPVAAAL